MLIGILQTGQSPDALRDDMGDYPDFFRELLANRGLSFRTYHVEAMQFPVSVHDCDGWLITGSRHGAYEDHPFVRPLETFIRKAMAEHVPLVGICFGHQIIAQAMGGKVERFEKGWAVGPQEYDFNGDKITLNAWHRDQVTEVPEGAEVCASNEFARMQRSSMAIRPSPFRHIPNSRTNSSTACYVPALRALCHLMSWLTLRRSLVMTMTPT